MDEVLSLLDRQGIVWKAKEDDRTVKNGENRPPFGFYPDSLDNFKEKLRGELGPKLGDETKLDDKTSLSIGSDYEEQFYSAWKMCAYRKNCIAG